MGDLTQSSKEVAKGSFWNLLGNTLTKPISFLYYVVLAYLAPKDVIGLFFLASGIIDLVMVFSDFGLPSALLRFVPYYEGKGEKDRISGLLRNTYIFVFLCALIFIILVEWQAGNISVIYHNPSLAAGLQLLALYIMIGGLFKVHMLYLQSRTAMRSMQFVQNLQALLKLVLTLLLFYAYGPTVFSMSAALLASYMISFLLSFYHVAKYSADLPSRSGPLDMRLMIHEILPFGFMLSILNSIVLAITTADRVLLGFLSAPQLAEGLVATYANVTTLAMALLVFPNSFEAIFFPVISRLVGKKAHEEDNEEIRSVCSTAQRWTILITIPFAIMLMVFSEEALALVFGDQYRAGAASLSIIAFAFLIRSFNSVSALTLAAMRRLDLEFRIYLFSALLNIILCLLLIPQFGMEGAAVASLAGFSMMSLLFQYYGKKLFGFYIGPEIFKIASAGLLSTILVYWMRSATLPLLSSLVLPSPLAPYSLKIAYVVYLGTMTALTFVFFGIICLLLKSLRKEDVVLLEKVLARAKIPPGALTWAEKLMSVGIHA